MKTKDLLTSPVKIGEGSPLGRSSMSRAKAGLMSPSQQMEDGSKYVDWRDYYIPVKQLVNQLNGKIDAQIAKNDGEFLAAYRSHMQQIQKELENMKKKMNECEFIIKKDQRVRKLEAQIGWFREEALYLSKQIKVYAE